MYNYILYLEIITPVHLCYNNVFNRTEQNRTNFNSSMYMVYKQGYTWKYVYCKYKFNRPHGPCAMTNYTNKHYTMT